MTFGAKYFTYVLYNVLYILQLHKIIFSPADQPYFPNFNPAVEFFFKSLASKSVPILTLPIGIILLVCTQNFSKKKLFFTHAPAPLPTFSEIVLCQGCFPGKFAFVSLTKASKIFLAPAFPEFRRGPCYRLICICRLRC